MSGAASQLISGEKGRWSEDWKRKEEREITEDNIRVQETRKKEQRCKVQWCWKVCEPFKFFFYISVNINKTK